MVAVVKWLTRRIVAPLPRGFDSLQSPHKPRGVAKSVRQRTLTPSCVGSSPAAPANKLEYYEIIITWPVGQAVKTPPFHGDNMGSIPIRVTKIRAISSAGRAPALQAGCRQFDPVIAHQKCGPVV